MGDHPILWLIIVFVFGSIVGSFLNVCIYRLPRGRSVFHPRRSYCPQCHESIAWHDNIPLLSYVLLGARCRHCGGAISARYPAVEALTACLFALSFYVLKGRGETRGVIVVYGALLAALVVATFIDLDLRLIPDSITVGGSLLAPLLSALVPELHMDPAGLPLGRQLLFFRGPVPGALAACAVGMAVGAFATWAIGVLGRKIFRREAMGLGDVKLMAMLGGLLGWKLALIVFFLAPIFGAVVGVVLLIRTRDHHIPYGPFLAAAAATAILAGDAILRGLRLA